MLFFYSEHKNNIKKYHQTRLPQRQATISIAIFVLQQEHENNTNKYPQTTTKILPPLFPYKLRNNCKCSNKKISFTLSKKCLSSRRTTFSSRKQNNNNKNTFGSVGCSCFFFIVIILHMA